MKNVLIIFALCFGFQVLAQNMPDKFADYYQKIEEQTFEKRIQELNKSIKKNPTEPWYYWMLASTYDIMENEEKTREYFEKSISIDSTFSAGYASYARFIRYTDSTNLDLALRHINTAIRLEPQELYYHIDRGFIYLGLKYFDQALSEANLAILNPDFDFLAASELKVQVLYESGKKEELKAFVKQYDLSQNSEFYGTDYCLLLASIYEEFGDLKKMCILYHSAAEPYEMMENEVPAAIKEKLKKCK